MTKTLKQDGYNIRIYNDHWEDSGDWRSAFFNVYKEKTLWGSGVLLSDGDITYNFIKVIDHKILEKIKKKALKFWEKYNKYDKP